MIKVMIKGEPVGKGRPRFTRSGQPYTPEKTKQYENYVKWCYKSQNGGIRYSEDVPLKVSIVALLKIPAATSKKKRADMLARKIKPTKKPDVDNITKIILDALNGLAYYDDKQIVQQYTEKWYSENPCVYVRIEEAE